MLCGVAETMQKQTWENKRNYRRFILLYMTENYQMYHTATVYTDTSTVYVRGKTQKWLHLESVSVKPGQSVSRGTPVGLTGNTGRSTAPHLHFQLDKGRKNIDPIDYHGTMTKSEGHRRN